MSQIADLINFLNQQLGKPYVLGDEGPDSYDCSGLTQTAFKQTCGIDLPRVSKDQYQVGQEVAQSDLQPGDILFFDTGVSANVPNHCGVCIGSGQMINANSYQNQVYKESYLSSYWQNAWYGVKRVVGVVAPGPGDPEPGPNPDPDPAPAQPFSDVPPTHEFYQWIMKLYQSGVVQGYPDGTFKPGQGINRAEVLKIILEAFKLPLSSSGSLPFSDVQSGDWFYKYVLTAYQKGIIQGYPDGTFKPGNNVNRVECLKMALETAGVGIPSSGTIAFEDVKPEHWYYGYVVYALDHELIAPVSSEKFGTAEDMKRGEMCKVVGELV